QPQLALSELSKLRGQALPDGLPEWDIPAIRGTIEAVRDAVRAGDLSSATDVAEGGVITAVAESAVSGGHGAELTITGTQADAWTTLFGEAPGLFLVSADADALARLAQQTKVTVVGKVGGDRLHATAGDLTIDEPLDALHAAWSGGLAPYFP
ncbi:MAG: phosphoribosylformylglycinamidine synthase subunit PurL, partial [Solirubrobacteraceae bacterium]|nr:phosphoribosylformylglycinamidine synthase subunit PurL [Solirubrobacteraceae bacterium]